MTKEFEPAYLSLLRSGKLKEHVELARIHMKNCDLCPRYCHVDRYQGSKGAI